MFDFIMGLVVVISFSLVCAVVSVEIIDGGIRSSMYTECLESKYDKFQCYSMIYGG